MAVIGLYLHRLASPGAGLTGVGRYAVELSGALHRRGTHRYVLLAPFEGARPDPAWPPVPVVRLGGDRRILQAGWALARRPRVDRLVPDLDLVHGLSPVSPLPADRPVVYTVHDLFPLDHPGWKRLRGRLLFHAALRHARRTACRIITPSGAVASAVRGRLRIRDERVVTVPEGVDERFRRAAPEPPRELGLEPGQYLLALGALVDRKNLGVVLEALAALPAGSRPHLVLAGPPGPAAARLRRRIARLGLRDGVTEAGFVEDGDLPGLVAGARGLVHPAVDEGFGLPVAEAMAAGVPVVAARAGSLPEVVGDAGLLVPPGRPAAWREALARLDDESLRAELSTRGRARADRFRWEATAAATEEVYGACLG